MYHLQSNKRAAEALGAAEMTWEEFSSNPGFLATNVGVHQGPLLGASASSVQGLSAAARGELLVILIHLKLTSIQSWFILPALLG